MAAFSYAHAERVIDTPTEGCNTDLGEIMATFNTQTDFPCVCHFERSEMQSRNLFPRWRNPFWATDLSAQGKCGRHAENKKAARRRPVR